MLSSRRSKKIQGVEIWMISQYFKLFRRYFHCACTETAVRAEASGQNS